MHWQFLFILKYCLPTGFLSDRIGLRWSDSKSDNSYRIGFELIRSDKTIGLSDRIWTDSIRSVATLT